MGGAIGPGPPKATLFLGSERCTLRHEAFAGVSSKPKRIPQLRLNSSRQPASNRHA